MATNSFAFWTYNLNVFGARTERSAYVDNIEITTQQPMGYAELNCDIFVPDSRTIPADLQLYARVAVMDGTFPVFLGRWDEPSIVLSDQYGTMLHCHAAGAADCLTDDPEDCAYTTQTPQAIVVDQISTFVASGAARSNFLPIDQDTSGIFPTNPSATYSPDPNGKDIKDVLNELIPLVGDYAWVVWGHPNHKDAFGFPTWQLLVHVRNTTTTNYTAIQAYAGGSGLDAYTVTPASEYSYNVIQVKYTDTTTLLPASVTVKDSRLTATNTQGTAPIPFRKLVKDFTSEHMSSTEATSVANALLSQYQNGGFKNTVILSEVFDWNGKPIPLCQVRADANILLPELTPIGSSIPTVTTQGTNLFYITTTRYSEASGQVPVLELKLDSFHDAASFQLARLEYIHKQLNKSHKVKHTVREVANPEQGAANIAWGSTALANDIYGSNINYKTTTTNTPSSITLSVNSQANVNTITAAAITNVGFELDAKVNANGAGHWQGTYLMHGN